MIAHRPPTLAPARCGRRHSARCATQCDAVAALQRGCHVAGDEKGLHEASSVPGAPGNAGGR